MIKITINRKEYCISEGDTFLDNGACVQLTSQNITKNFSSTSPKVPKKIWKKLLSHPSIRLEKEEGFLKYYKFTMKKKFLVQIEERITKSVYVDCLSEDSIKENLEEGNYELKESYSEELIDFSIIKETK